MKFILWIKWLLEQALGANAAISFGRAVSLLIVLYFLVMDALFFFHNGHHFVDNATLLTQLSVMTAFYVTNKAHDAVASFSDKNDQVR